MIQTPHSGSGGQVGAGFGAGSPGDGRPRCKAVAGAFPAGWFPAFEGTTKARTGLLARLGSVRRRRRKGLAPSPGGLGPWQAMMRRWWGGPGDGVARPAAFSFYRNG